MKFHPAQQGSLEWMLARSGIPTASELDNLLTPEMKIRTGQRPATYLARKVAERWLRGPLADYAVWDMEQGKILEEEAIPFFELEFNATVSRVGLVTTDDGKVGCSPDGIIGETCGIEVKCPAPQTQVSYLLGGTIPKDYLLQVHGGMYVTGFKQWKFMSYSRRFPPVILTIDRDDEIIAAIHEALTLFTAKLDRAYETLVSLNGGPPKQNSMRPKAPDALSEQEGEVTP